MVLPLAHLLMTDTGTFPVSIKIFPKHLLNIILLLVAQINAQLADGLTTYATIQFGHNDQKVGDAALMGEHLVTMVEEIVSLGAIPILVTPLTRRSFGSDGTVSDTLQEFADATISVADQEGVHVIDLHATSIKYCEAIGEEACQRLNKTPDDNTRMSAYCYLLVCSSLFSADLNNNGSIVFGRYVTSHVLSVVFSLTTLLQ